MKGERGMKRGSGREENKVEKREGEGGTTRNKIFQMEQLSLQTSWLQCTSHANWEFT
jgi:hypothetical protein